MKVLYVASNPVDPDTLMVEQEITELQKTAANTSGDPVRFTFMPALPFEEIESQLAIVRPDILHLAAHGTSDGLWLSKSLQGEVRVTAAALQAILTAHTPRLVLLNACSSGNIAGHLVPQVRYAIGTNRQITNLAARKGAVAFYRCLIRGQSLDLAFHLSRSIIGTLDDGVQTILFAADGSDPKQEILHRTPRIVAHFEDHAFARRSGYRFALGLSGASADTVQVVFCTDDESFIPLRAQDQTEFLCSVERTTPIKNEIWLNYCWSGIVGDFRIYALATTASGECYSVADTLCEALTRFYKIHYRGEAFPRDLSAALDDLRANDGSRLRPRDRPSVSRTNRKKPATTRSRATGPKHKGRA